MKFKSIIAAAFLIIGCSSHEKLEPDYQMYSSLLSSEFASKGLWIIKQESELPSFGVNRTHLKTNLDALSDETLDNFLSKSKEVVLLQNRFDSKLTIKLIGNSELDSLFKTTGDDGWNNLRNHLGPNHGIAAFSPVGYNKDQTQALLYFGNTQGSLAGAGYYVLFEKRFGTWTEVARTMAWIS